MTELSRRAWLRTALIAGGVGTAGCIVAPSEGDDEREPTPRPEGEIDDPPDLLVLADGETDGGNNHTANELWRLAYDAGEEQYEATATYTPEDGRRITSFDRMGDGYAVAGSDPTTDAEVTRLTVLDETMAPRETRDLSGWHTLATDGDIVFTAYEDGFLSFDTDLERLGETSLPDELAGKHMEDVLVYDGVAYVVDNVVYPMYLFRIDVSDPTDPSYLEVLETMGIGQSLHQQWLEPDANGWRFLQTTSHRAGGEQNVILTPMTDAASGGTVEGPNGEIDRRAGSELDSVQIHQWTRDGAPDDLTEDREYGIRIRDVSSLPPVFAVVDDGEDRYLSSVDVDGTDVTFGREVAVERIARIDTTPGLAVALSGDGDVLLFDTDEGVLGHELASPVDEPLDVTVLES